MASQNRFPALMVALAVGLMAGPAAGLAQSDAPQPPAAQESETPETPAAQAPAEDLEITDDQLQAFAAATVRIVRIQQEAQQAMQSAVQDAGLSIDEYNAIAQKAQTDEAVDAQLRELIGEELGG